MLQACSSFFLWIGTIIVVDQFLVIGSSVNTPLYVFKSFSVFFYPTFLNISAVNSFITFTTILKLRFFSYLLVYYSFVRVSCPPLFNVICCAFSFLTVLYCFLSPMFFNISAVNSFITFTTIFKLRFFVICLCIIHLYEFFVHLCLLWFVAPSPLLLFSRFRKIVFDFLYCLFPFVAQLSFLIFLV